MPMELPRVYVVRHGETEWSKSGKHTSRTDLPLTKRGRERVLESAAGFVGPNRVIQPDNIAQIFVSPMQRAHETLRLLGLPGTIPRETTALIREWDYGEYEGITTREIKATRPDWDLWRDGCPGGESPQEMVERIDQLITGIKAIQTENYAAGRPADVLIVAHAHVLRSLVTRWVRQDITNGSSYLMDAGAVGVLSFDHDLSEPAIKRWNILCDRISFNLN